MFLFDTVESFTNFPMILSNGYPKEFHFLVYIDDFDHKLTKSMAEKESGENFSPPIRLFPHQTFLVKTKNVKDSLSLITFEAFQQPNCRDWKPTEVNRYSRKKKSWKSKEYFIQKHKNFNGCRICVPVPVPQTLFRFSLNENKKVNSIWGFSHSVLEALRTNQNFSYEYKIFHRSGLKGTITDTTCHPDFWINYTSIRTLGSERVFDESLQIKLDAITDGFTTMDEIILISRSEPYTQFEKIILPFEKEVWHWLIATVAIAAMMILVLKFMKKNIQNLVFGSEVQTPLLNLM